MAGRLAVLLLAASVWAAAQDAEGVELRIPVWTSNSAIEDATHVTAAVDGKAAEIVRLQGPAEDLMLLVILDLVADLNEIELARQALLDSIAELPENTYVGLLRAQDGLEVMLDPTDDRAAIADAIRGFSVRGTPGLLETVDTASQLADSILTQSGVRIAICYITDSDVRGYREDFTNAVINRSDRGDLSRRFPEGRVRERISQLTGTLGARQTPLFIVHLSYRTDQLNEAYQNGLMQLASTTGGKTVFCRSSAEIGSAVGQTLETIVQHYSLDVAVEAADGANVAITLESDVGPLDYRNRYRIRWR